MKWTPMRLAEHHGVDVTYYTPRPAPWHKLPEYGAVNFALVLGLSAFFYGAVRLPKGIVRTLAAWAGIIVFILAPSRYGFGRSGLGIIDFGMPAWAFLAFLHIVDIFFLRPQEEVTSWPFSRLVCQIFAYPNEHNPSDTPRLKNIQALQLCALKYVGVNMLLYFVPTPEIWSQIKPLSFPYFVHAGVVGLTVLGTLGFLIEGMLLGIGVLFGVEMSPLFDNPMGATNIRSFWSRWNLVIKDGLSRVFFHFKAPPSRRKSKSESHASTAASAKGNGVANGHSNGHNLRQRPSRGKGDYLSETEIDSDSAPSSPPTREKKSAQPKDLLKQKQSTTAKTAPKSKSPFFPKAVAAAVTFMASGLFHEYMNAIAFDGATGETVAFFLLHAAGTIAYSYLKREFPAIPRAVPWPLSVLLTNIFAFGGAALFVAPFIRASFFEMFKAYGLFGPVNGFIWVFGDGHGRHVPQYLNAHPALKKIFS